ncbi:MAG: hypothetical protein RIT37_637, partial [Bacteroidota bacterium]
MKSNSPIAFVGTPNCGKTTVFNVLTGMRKKVGNFPGITIEPSLGSVSSGKESIEILDLPGLYSMLATSFDEELTMQVLKKEHVSIKHPHGIVFVMDATNIEKSLYLYSQVAELGIPMIIALTMVDGVKARSGVIDDIAIERLTGLSVFPIVGHKGIGLEDLKQGLLNEQSWHIPILPPSFDEIRDRVHWAKNTADAVLSIKEPDTLTSRLDAILLHP